MRHGVEYDAAHGFEAFLAQDVAHGPFPVVVEAGAYLPVGREAQAALCPEIGKYGWL